jgi:hypothetical protein
VLAGANKDTADNNGWTPLHCASYRAREEIVDLLISEGADTYALTNNDKSALDLANSEIVARIKNGRKLRSWGQRGWLVIMHSTAKKARLLKIESAKKQKA